MPAHVLFVTGKLAAPALRQVLAELAPRAGFQFTVAVLPITVVSLATTPWIASHLTMPASVDRLVIPGLCKGPLDPIAARAGLPVERGPNDLRDMAEHFQASTAAPPVLETYDIAILAEINHAQALPLSDLLARARAHKADGADVIDLGCDPGSTWSGVGEATQALRGEGFRVSIDSFDPAEVARAIDAGAELVLSVNSTNVSHARSWGCEVVAIPDHPADLQGLDFTVERLTSWGIPFRLDPVLEPIGLGFAASLGRFLEARRRYPGAAMMMGVGNLTELTDVDSAGVNVLLLGFCQEVDVRSVLTTEVINWCRSCVRELDLARRLVFHAVANRVLPKRLCADLVMLRDPKLRRHSEQALAELAGRITDRHFRLFAEEGQLHAINDKMHVKGADPFALFKQICEREMVDPSHAFYLGYEMAKAATALTLGKNYVQDQALRWGFLTRPENDHHNQGNS
jgi:dihydropteroate synthase-like protein